MNRSLAGRDWIRGERDDDDEDDNIVRMNGAK